MFRRAASVFCAVILCVLTAGCAVNNTIDEQEKSDAAYEKANTSEAYEQLSWISGDIQRDFQCDR